MKRNICLVLALWLLGKGSLFAQKHKTSIPFELTSHHNIIIKATLNHKDNIRLMLHTAASDLTLTEDALKKLNTVVFTSTLDSIKSWGGTNQSARVSQNNTLAIQDLEWHNIEIIENVNSGPGSDGKVGINLFKNKVISFDFDKKLIYVSATLSRNLRKYTKLKLTPKGDMLFMEAVATVNGAQFTNQYLLHSGYAGSLLLDDNFTQKAKLSESLKIIKEKTLKDSYGNSLKTLKAILPSFSVGPFTFKDAWVGFFEGSIGRQKTSIIGGDLLKRFNFIIDSTRSYIYLRPNKLYPLPFSD